MSSIDPTDVPPASNLPGPSVAWGRNRDEHILALEKKIISLEQAQAGANRDRAASLANLSGQLNDVSALVASQVGVDGGSYTDWGFGLTSGAWETIVSTSVTAPSWASQVVVTGIGMVYMVANDASARPYMRMTLGGSTSQEVELPPGTGTSTFPLFATIADTSKLTGLVGGAGVSVSIQVKVSDASQWNSGVYDRRVQLNATGVFTR